jgi:hypothetical protein
MHPIGSRIYTRNRNLKTADKTESRALIGYLVGYQGTNIFHIWLLTKDNIFVTRDVIFDTDKFYTEDEYYTPESVIEEVIELLEYPPTIEDNNIELKELLTHQQCRNHCNGCWDVQPGRPDEVPVVCRPSAPRIS